MYSYLGNYSKEGHGQSLYTHEIIIDSSILPKNIPSLIEAAIPRLNLTGDNKLNGFVNCYFMKGEPIHCVISLYSFSCDGVNCVAGEHSSFSSTSDLSESEQKTLTSALSENPKYIITNDNKSFILKSIGLN